MISIGTVAAVAGIVFAAAVLQRAVGFGFALLAVPLMAFVVPTKSAVVIVFLNGTITPSVSTSSETGLATESMS